MSDTSDVLLSIVEKVSGLPSSTSGIPFLGDFLLLNKKEKQVITEETPGTPFYVKLWTVSSNENTSKTCQLNQWTYTLLLMHNQAKRNIKQIEKYVKFWATIRMTSR